MKAVAFRENLPVEREDCLMDVELARPDARGRDLLVRIEAVAVNPVDTKVRRFHAPPYFAAIISPENQRASSLPEGRAWQDDLPNGTPPADRQVTDVTWLLGSVLKSLSQQVWRKTARRA